MSWEDILKGKNLTYDFVEEDDIFIKYVKNLTDDIFIKFVKNLTDGLIDKELEDHLSATTSDDPHYKNHEIALKEVLYDDLFENIADRLLKAIDEVVFKEGTIHYDEYSSSSGILVLIEAIDTNEKELESKNLEW